MKYVILSFRQAASDLGFGRQQYFYKWRVSKWQTNNIIDISSLFDGCISLFKIPDISKWNVDKLKSMDFLFRNCLSLSEIPNIFILDVNGIFFKNSIFR